jgi:hypothetical protein
MESMIGIWSRSATLQVSDPYRPSHTDPDVLGLKGNRALGFNLPGSEHPLDTDHRRTRLIRTRAIGLPRDNGPLIQGILQLNERG